jgi:NADP-dependent 3-hydroxy acid dehydrogenase YdfG
MVSKLITIIAGVGSGTGASIARKFAAAYPVVLLARKPESYSRLANDINQGRGKAIGISTDLSDSQSVRDAVEAIKMEFGPNVGAAVSTSSSHVPTQPHNIDIGRHFQC